MWRNLITELKKRSSLEAKFAGIIPIVYNVIIRTRCKDINQSANTKNARNQKWVELSLKPNMRISSWKWKNYTLESQHHLMASLRNSSIKDVVAQRRASLPSRSFQVFCTHVHRPWHKLCLEKYLPTSLYLICCFTKAKNCGLIEWTSVCSLFTSKVIIQTTTIK